MKRISVGMSAAAVAAAVSLTSAPAASAAPAAEAGVQSVWGKVHGGHSIWNRVNPFSGKRVDTTIEGEDIFSSCKRWGADGKWWYWTAFYGFDGGYDFSGHVAGDATNIRHSHLPKCD